MDGFKIVLFHVLFLSIQISTGNALICYDCETLFDNTECENPRERNATVAEVRVQLNSEEPTKPLCIKLIAYFPNDTTKYIIRRGTDWPEKSDYDVCDWFTKYWDKSRDLSMLSLDNGLLLDQINHLQNMRIEKCDVCNEDLCNPSSSFSKTIRQSCFFVIISVLFAIFYESYFFPNEK